VGVGVHVVPTTARGLDIPAVLAQLRDAGVESVLIEGGARVVTSVLAAALVDRIVVGTVPKIMGNGTNAIGDLGVGRVTEAIRLINRTV
jgi:riboflavin biosynthesis pyrimidine reductase